MLFDLGNYYLKSQTTHVHTNRYTHHRTCAYRVGDFFALWKTSFTERVNLFDSLGVGFSKRIVHPEEISGHAIDIRQIMRMKRVTN